ncbi:MAG: hypothetical protein ABEN55_23150 [Bradymonadaceae bacterium]
MSVSSEVLRQTADRIQTTKTAKTVGNAARAAASASFVKELLKMCGKAGAAGAIVDGAVGGVQASKYVRNGVIDKQQAAKHVGAEAGCGFVTSSSGTGGTLAVFMVTGSMGPAALAAGMGASMGSRYLYRQVVGETLPSEEELEEMHREARPDEEPDIEDIGPGAQASSSADIEDIGPGAKSEPSPPPSESPSESDESGDETASDDEGPWESIGPDA